MLTKTHIYSIMAKTEKGAIMSKFNLKRWLNIALLRAKFKFRSLFYSLSKLIDKKSKGIFGGEDKELDPIDWFKLLQIIAYLALLTIIVFVGYEPVLVVLGQYEYSVIEKFIILADIRCKDTKIAAFSLGFGILAVLTISVLVQLATFFSKDDE